jgi:uncharacterized protein (TIGR00369 family)
MHFTEEHARIANGFIGNTLVQHLGIQFLVDDHGHFCATMPVDHRTHQPMGLLHGGATAALAESLGSMGSALIVDPTRNNVVGIEVNANHLKSVTTGTVKATGTILHAGRTTHVWDIRVTNEQDQLVAVCRLTVVVVPRR